MTTEIEYAENEDDGREILDNSESNESDKQGFVGASPISSASDPFCPSGISVAVDAVTKTDKISARGKAPTTVVGQVEQLQTNESASGGLSRDQPNTESSEHDSSFCRPPVTFYAESQKLREMSKLQLLKANKGSMQGSGCVLPGQDGTRKRKNDDRSPLTGSCVCGETDDLKRIRDAYCEMVSTQNVCKSTVTLFNKATKNVIQKWVKDAKKDVKNNKSVKWYYYTDKGARVKVNECFIRILLTQFADLLVKIP